MFKLLQKSGPVEPGAPTVAEASICKKMQASCGAMYRLRAWLSDKAAYPPATAAVRRSPTMCQSHTENRLGFRQPVCLAWFLGRDRLRRLGESSMHCYQLLASMDPEDYGRTLLTRSHPFRVHLHTFPMGPSASCPLLSQPLKVCPRHDSDWCWRQF